MKKMAVYCKCVGLIVVSFIIFGRVESTNAGTRPAGAGFTVVAAQGKYGGGTGEPNEPYLIYDENQMNAIGADSSDWDKHFKLMADIDLSGYTGTSFNIIGTYWDNPFTGVFDGNSHTISNFSYKSTGKSYIGLFGCVGQLSPDRKTGDIRDLGLVDPNVDGGTGGYVGSLVGYLGDGTVTKCYVGGGSVSGARYVGGLVGLNLYLCFDSECLFGTITNCYSTAKVAGTTSVGGLVGYNYGGIMTYCYSAGSVSGTTEVGGLVGRNIGHVLASFWDIETSGQTTSDGGTGKTTAEMQTASTFVGLGCGSVWTIDEGNDYPRLWWENKPGEIITNTSYGGGSGDANDPYLIYTAEQLNTIGLIPCDWDKHFKLMADIDLSRYTGTEFNIIGTGYLTHPPVGRSHLVSIPFTGTFDGNAFEISNFNYYSCTGIDFIDCIGLFGVVDGVNAQIKDLGLIDPNVEAKSSMFSVMVGSIIGILVNGTVIDCYTQGGSVSGDFRVGGLVGSNEDTITNCYANVNVSGYGDIGGLVGWNYRGTITNCYSTGSVTGGGLVGSNYGTISNCFWDTETSGQDWSDGGTGLLTEDMQKIVTFTNAGWDFVGETANGTEDIWRLCEDLVNYPRLAWEFTLVDFVCPDGVNFVDFSFFAGHWQEDNCGASNDCEGTDLDQLGTVDINDLGIFVDNWLAGH